MRISTLLADDHVIVRDGLKNLLLREGFDVIAEASDGHEAVRLAKELCPAIAVLDIFMPLLNGLDAARQINKICPQTKTILLTMYKEDQYVLEALKAGVKGYVLKSQASRDLVLAIREVLNGSIYLSPAATGALVKAWLAKGGEVSEVSEVSAVSEVSDRGHGGSREGDRRHCREAGAGSFDRSIAHRRPGTISRQDVYICRTSRLQGRSTVRDSSGGQGRVRFQGHRAGSGAGFGDRVDRDPASLCLLRLAQRSRGGHL